MIKATNLSKSYGGQKLFEEASFTVNPGERVGLVGRNGHGKTTLLRILSGEEHTDTGEFTTPRNYTIGFVRQHLSFSKPSVIEEACLGLPEHHGDEKWMAEKILSGLGFSKEEMLRPPAEFSGGYQIRLNLTKVLVSDPDALLLDEPTNYLDVVSIRWLAQFLREWKKALVLVTHDRSFMDRVTTHTMGIHRKRIRKVAGDTGVYYEQILREEEIYEKTRVNDEKKRKEVELFINRFRAKARLAGLVQSRVKAMQKMEKLDRLEQIKNLDFTFTYKPFNAKVCLNAKELTFSYDPGGKGKPLIDDFSISIGTHDRICVIGKNGRGKTTLLRLLAGELKPRYGGIEMHPNTQTGYFAQTNTIRLNPNCTIEDEIMLAGCERQQARDIAGAMMFEGDDALKRISVLSGGEKSRVLLGKILAGSCNLLFLDEPTNHLDMESCDALIAAIDDFPGAVVMVTHNEMFLHSLATRFVVFQNERVSVFEGSYQSFLDKVGWEDEEQLKKETKTSDDLVNKKDIRKLRADIITRRSRELKPVEARIAQIEREIGEGEKEIASLNEEIVAASQTGNGKTISELSIKLHGAQKKVDALYLEFDELSTKADQLQKMFDEELAGLGS